MLKDYDQLAADLMQAIHDIVNVNFASFNVDLKTGDCEIWTTHHEGEFSVPLHACAKTLAEAFEVIRPELTGSR